MRPKFIFLTTVLLIVTHFISATACQAANLPPGGQSVKIWEETIVIPTYLVAAPETNPMFYDGEVTGVKSIEVGTALVWTGKE